MLSQIYGASVTFFEQLQSEKLSDEIKTVLRLDEKVLCNFISIKLVEK